jgi:hypothetical protein
VVQVSTQIYFIQVTLCIIQLLDGLQSRKNNLMSCCILELWLWNISVFINLKLLDLFYVFILLLLKTHVSYILFSFLFSNHMLVLYAVNLSCHIVIFSIENFLICYTWHNYFLKICLMMCEDLFSCI